MDLKTGQGQGAGAAAWVGAGRSVLRLLGPARGRNAIYAFALFAAAVLALWRGIALHGERVDLIDDAQSTTAVVTRNAVDGIDRALDVAELQLREVQGFIAREGGLDRLAPARLQQFLAKRAGVTAFDENILVANAAGDVIAMSNKGPSAPTNVADRGWFRAHGAVGSPAMVSAVRRDPATKRIAYRYTQAIPAPDGSFAGLVAVALPASFIAPPAQRALAQPLVSLWLNGSHFLFSNFMTFDAHGDPVPPVTPYRVMPKAQSGFLDGNPGAITAFSKGAPGRHLFATATVQRAEVLQRWHNEVATSLILFLVVVTVGGILARTAASLAEADRRARAALEESTRALTAALGERDILLKEIHHRVKNNLQLTSSLMQIQAQAFDNRHVRDAFKETQQRLYAIGIIHDVLYFGAAQPAVDMNRYLARLSAEIARDHDAAGRGIALRLDIAPVELVAEEATVIGLLTSEILLSAYKHAFPDEGGQIALDLSEKDGLVALQIAATGHGFSDGVAFEGSLGGRLVRALSGRLHGQYSFDGSERQNFHLTFRKFAGKGSAAPA
jgi:two-component sensor histidine kinase